MSVKERWEKTSPLNFSTEDAISLLLPLLKSDSRILIAYLFGSRAKKQEQSPDIDIAIYTSDNFSWDACYMLYGELTKKLHSDRIDLVWLNEADPILCFEVIKNGRVLFYKDADVLNDFELRFKKRYYDYSLYINKHRRYREGGL
ncbi:MAG: nucleotidyltransferase domain-containing protein [Nitrospirota bacterium]